MGDPIHPDEEARRILAAIRHSGYPPWPQDFKYGLEVIRTDNYSFDIIGAVSEEAKNIIFSKTDLSLFFFRFFATREERNAQPLSATDVLARVDIAPGWKIRPEHQLFYELVGNPHPVFDGRWDESEGFSEETIGVFDPGEDLAKDISRIILAVNHNGYKIEPIHAYYAWDQYSSSLEAHWLMVPDDDENIFDSIRRFLLVKSTPS